MSVDSTRNRATVTFTRKLGAFAFAYVLVAALFGPGAFAHASASGSPHPTPGISDSGLPPLRSGECPTPSINRLQKWLATGEGTTVPATGSLLVREGDQYAAKVKFLKAEWHVTVVWLANQFDAQVDLSKSAGFWMTYSATDDLYVQLRPASHWSGGDKWLTPVPSTGGKRVTRFFSFSSDAWKWLPELGKPSYSFTSALREARGLVFVGKTPNRLDFRGLRIDGYTPPCL